MDRTGSCLCGAVTFTAHLKNTDAGACHCGMCRKWTGGPLVSMHTEGVTFHTSDTLSTYTSSQWAERGFCSTCGSCLFYRITVGPAQGQTILALGSLNDLQDVALTHEVYTDMRPAAYAFEGELAGMTEAEVMAKYGG